MIASNSGALKKNVGRGFSPLVLLFILFWVNNVLAAQQQIPFAKQATELKADYNQPSDITADAQGQLYILDLSLIHI